MSVATEITRLQGAKADLKTSIEAKGVTVPSATLISGYAALVDQISGGGIPDSDGLFDLSIATGDMSTSASTLTLTYMPRYLLRYSPSSAMSNVSGFSISKSVTYPAVVWTCNSQRVTISGYTATIQVGTDADVIFTATWKDYNGDTQTTSKTIHVMNLAYAMIATTGYTSVDDYFVTTTWPDNISARLSETYRHDGTDYYICEGSAAPPSWGGAYYVLSNNGTSAANFWSAAAAKAAIDTL